MPADSETNARAAALKLLGRREHSARELSGKLLRRGFAPATIDAVLGRLTAEQLLCDSRFAEAYAHSRAQRGYGPLRIRAELRQRGVTDVAVTQALNELEPLWQTALVQVQKKRFGLSSNVDDRDEQMRQTRLLNRRGFTLEQIKQLFSRH